MIATLEQFDMRLLLFLNGLHHPLLDPVMFWLTKGIVWLPVYLLLLFFIIKHYKMQTFFIILFVALLITITDQSSVQLFKNVFMRLRPCSDPRISSLVHIVNGYRSGGYSFISSHSTTFFGLAFFMTGILGSKVRFFAPIAFSIVLIIVYTRIYLGVHFPGDIICGSIVGSLIGFGMQKLFRVFSKRILSRSIFALSPDKPKPTN